MPHDGSLSDQKDQPCDWRVEALSHVILSWTPGRSSLNFDFKPSSFPTSPALRESPEKSVLKVHTCCTTAASSDLTCIEPLLEWANLFQFVFSNYPVLLSRTFGHFGVFLFSYPSDILLLLLLPSVRPISRRSYGYWWLSPSTCILTRDTLSLSFLVTIVQKFVVLLSSGLRIPEDPHIMMLPWLPAVQNSLLAYLLI